MEELYYTEAGQGVPIIFVHGSLSTGMETFRRQMEFFSTDYRCICPDLRCHGNSTSFRHDWTTETLEEDIIQLLDRLSVDKAHFVGHSMGGEIVKYTALKHKDRVLSVTTVSSGGARNDRIIAYLSRLDPDKLDPERFGNFLDHIRNQHAAANQGDWKGFIRRSIWNSENFPGFTDEELGRMDMPFLLIRGTKDRLVLDQEVERLQRCIPNLQVTEVEGRHALTSDEKTAPIVNQCISEFMRSAKQQLKRSAKQR